MDGMINRSGPATQGTVRGRDLGGKNIGKAQGRSSSLDVVRSTSGSKSPGASGGGDMGENNGSKENPARPLPARVIGDSFSDSEVGSSYQARTRRIGKRNLASRKRLPGDTIQQSISGAEDTIMIPLGQKLPEREWMRHLRNDSLTIQHASEVLEEIITPTPGRTNQSGLSMDQGWMSSEVPEQKAAPHDSPVLEETRTPTPGRTNQSGLSMDQGRTGSEVPEQKAAPVDIPTDEVIGSPFPVKDVTVYDLRSLAGRYRNTLEVLHNRIGGHVEITPETRERLENLAESFPLEKLVECFRIENKNSQGVIKEQERRAEFERKRQEAQTMAPKMIVTFVSDQMQASGNLSIPDEMARRQQADLDSQIELNARLAEVEESLVKLRSLTRGMRRRTRESKIIARSRGYNVVDDTTTEVMIGRENKYNQDEKSYREKRIEEVKKEHLDLLLQEKSRRDEYDKEAQRLSLPLREMVDKTFGAAWEEETAKRQAFDQQQAEYQKQLSDLKAQLRSLSLSDSEEKETAERPAFDQQQTEYRKRISDLKAQLRSLSLSGSDSTSRQI